MVLSCLHGLGISCVPPVLRTYCSSSDSQIPSKSTLILGRRRAIALGSSLVVASVLELYNPIPKVPSFHSAIAQQQQQQEDELQEEEDRIVDLFQAASPSAVFIEDLELAKIPKSSSNAMLTEDENAKVEGTGSGFIWDRFGHIVTNYHVVAKLATDRSGLKLCKVLLRLSLLLFLFRTSLDQLSSFPAIFLNNFILLV
uniref:Uncharacterized protein MANES_17G072000 n=1 Tax=Rhizophora mucronata TaxID=61149 RepID=A0A2P2KH34_RHIMU